MKKEHAKPKINPIDFDKIDAAIKKEKSDRIARLEKESKPLHELVHELEFIVEEVISNQEATIYTKGELMVGGHNHSYSGGYQSTLNLKVKPYPRPAPIKELVFNGMSTVEAGHHITAKIPAYRGETESGLPQGSYNGLFAWPEHVYYLPIELKKKESAIELMIKSASGNILRIDRSVDYNKFVKPKGAKSQDEY